MIISTAKIARLDFTKFISLLPGKSKILLDISVITPDQIIQDLNLIKGKQYDTVIMLNVDPWHFHSSEERLFDHPSLKNKTVVIQTQEYQSKYLGNNHWRISYPGWYAHRLLPKDRTFKIKNKNLPMGFGCLNNRPALHRLLLGTELFNRGLLNRVIFVQNNSQSMWNSINNYTTGEIDPKLHQDQELLNSIPGFLEYKKLLPIRWQHLPITNNHTIHHPVELEAYCNITTESTTEMIPYERNVPLPEVSEKSAKPFISGQVPLFLAASGHNSYFKSLGYELMEDLTGPEFDTLRTRDKISAIADVVAKGRDFIEDFYFSHIDQIKYNYDLVCSDKTDQILLDRVKAMFQ